MELRTISPIRDSVEGQLKIKSLEIKAHYENLLRYGYDARDVYTALAEALNAETNKYLPAIMSDVPVYVYLPTTVSEVPMCFVFDNQELKAIPQGV